MRRAHVRLDEETYRKLRLQAFRQERSISSLVREMVEQGLARGAARKKLTSVAQFASVRASRTKQRRLSPVSERHDEALAATLKQ